jgi:(p)ppGpp synthase/HD superfamily hydrolase
VAEYPEDVADLVRSFDPAGVNYEGILVAQAIRFAAIKHDGQRRKYTHEPYLFHPIEVMRYVGMVSLSYEHREPMMVAAVLHDVVEDTDATIEEVAARFGTNVARMVAGLTDASRPEDGSRSERKRIDREHASLQAWDTQTIKCADIISNAKSIVASDPKFATMYLPEKAMLVVALEHADPIMRSLAMRVIDDGLGRLNV